METFDRIEPVPKKRSGTIKKKSETSTPTSARIGRKTAPLHPSLITALKGKFPRASQESQHELNDVGDLEEI